MKQMMLEMWNEKGAITVGYACMCAFNPIIFNNRIRDVNESVCICTVFMRERKGIN